MSNIPVITEPAAAPPPVNTYSPDDSAFTNQRLSEGDSAIADILKDLSPVDTGPDTALPEDAEVPSAPDAAATAAAETTAAVPAEPAKTEPAVDERATLRLLEREKAASDRELALEKRERDQTEKLKAIEERLAKSIDPKDLAKQLDEDVLGFFEQAGVDPVQVSRLIIAAKLGDKAPPEVRDAAEKYRRQKELAEIRQSVKDLKFEEEVRRVKLDVASFVDSTSTGDSKYPALRAVAAVDKSLANQAILEEIARDAHERGIKEPGEKLLSREEAAAKVESRWEVFRRAFTAAAPSTAGTVPAPATTAPQGTNEKTADTKTPPARPVPPRRYWQDDRDSEVSAALAEALSIATRKS